MDLHSDVTAAWDILMPASIPVVDTLQHKAQLCILLNSCFNTYSVTLQETNSILSLLLFHADRCVCRIM